MGKRKKPRANHVYLGKIVPDIGFYGLRNHVEAAAIAGAIMSDVEHGRVSKKTGITRLALLKHVARAQGILTKSLESLIDSSIAMLEGKDYRKRGKARSKARKGKTKDKAKSEGEKP